MGKPVLLFALLIFSGCASTQSTQFARVEYGRPNKVVDGIGWVVGIPNKLILWNRRIDNHRVGEETVAITEEYLDYNGLDDVMIRVNQYSPIGEWRRLTQNHRVAPGWRYTLGAWHWVGYTVFPGRIFGGDRYNPYTNSIYVFSDVPEMALAEAGYAKDLHQRAYPGTYAAVNELPLVNMWHETIATQDVLAYVSEEGNYEDQISAQHVLYARYGQRAGQSLGALFSTSVAVPLELGGAALGHLSGRTTTPVAPVDAESLASRNRRGRPGSSSEGSTPANLPVPAAEDEVAAKTDMVKPAPERATPVSEKDFDLVGFEAEADAPPARVSPASKTAP